MVLYLAGPDALDVQQACRRGFDQRNMIAVERDVSSLQKIRRAGFLAIDGDICDVMDAWPHEKKLGVVIADFCCGMESEIVNRVARGSAHGYAFADTLFCFNFLRGRDPSSNSDRAMCFGDERISDHKHRGEIFFQLYAASVVANCLGAASTGEPDWNDPDHRLDAALDVVRRWANPRFYSYRSTAGNQYFDSVVFKSVMGHGIRMAGGDARPHHKQIIPDDLMHQKRKISAVLAHRTMRMR